MREIMSTRVFDGGYLYGSQHYDFFNSFFLKYIGFLSGKLLVLCSPHVVSPSCVGALRSLKRHSVLGGLIFAVFDTFSLKHICGMAEHRAILKHLWAYTHYCASKAFVPQYLLYSPDLQTQVPFIHLHNPPIIQSPKNTPPQPISPIYNPASTSLYMLVCLKGYLTASSFLSTIFFFFLVVTCSTHTSFVISVVNFRMNRGSHSSDAIPRSLQHRIRALDLQPSVAVGMPSGSKYCCSPRAMETSLKG
jgi:hypothetical protein